MVLAKSSKDQQNYDILVYTYKASKVAKIPDFIKIIQSYSLKFTNLHEITFPKHLKIIGNGAFKFYNNLKIIQFPEDSEIEEIGMNAFTECPIKTFSVPNNLKRIGERAFYSCEELTNIEIQKDSNLQTIEERAFAFTKINKIYIPSKLTDLKDGWCINTNYLNQVKVSPKNKIE